MTIARTHFRRRAGTIRRTCHIDVTTVVVKLVTMVTAVPVLIPIVPGVAQSLFASRSMAAFVFPTGRGVGATATGVMAALSLMNHHDLGGRTLTFLSVC